MKKNICGILGNILLTTILFQLPLQAQTVVQSNQEQIQYNEAQQEQATISYFPQTFWGKSTFDVIEQHPYPDITKEQLYTYVKQTDEELYNQIIQAKDKGEPYLVWVNVPSYRLRVFDTSNGHMLLQSRVVVGATGSQTPSFTTQIINLKFNPDWTPPESLKRRGRHYVPPGINNPLGKLRFSTTDKYQIYLHDTNHKEYFNRNYRALSSGCIRVEQWQGLAEILGHLTPNQIENKTQGNTTHYMKINPSRVWVSYRRIDYYKGKLSIFPDVYRKDTLTVNGYDTHSEKPVPLY